MGENNTGRKFSNVQYIFWVIFFEQFAESSLQVSAGFTVQTDSPVTLQDRDRLVFGSILYRSDDGFSISESILTSVYSGVYLFHITICSQGEKLIARAVVCKNYNHRWVGFAYAEDSWNSECGSNTLVVEARKGDRFWVRSHKKSYIAAGSRFSGTLIYRTEWHLVWNHSLDHFKRISNVLVIYSLSKPEAYWSQRVPESFYQNLHRHTYMPLEDFLHIYVTICSTVDFEKNSKIFTHAPIPMQSFKSGLWSHPSLGLMVWTYI